MSKTTKKCGCYIDYSISGDFILCKKHSIKQKKIEINEEYQKRFDALHIKLPNIPKNIRNMKECKCIRFPSIGKGNLCEKCLVKGYSEKYHFTIEDEE